jgi:hypothetical protein
LSFSAWPKGLKLAVTVAGLIIVVALTVVITLAIERRTPAFARVGKAVAQAPLTLRRQPGRLAATSGNINAGEQVELLEHLPAKGDEWALIRSAKDTNLYGYARLEDLDRVQTSSPEYDLWHEVQSLKKATGAELKQKLATIDLTLRTNPVLPSDETDQIYRDLAREGVRLAKESSDNIDDARSAIISAETYLGRVSVQSQEAAETVELRTAIQELQNSIGVAGAENEAASAPTPVPAPPSARTELSRLLKEANSAFAAGRYARVVEIYQQIAAKGQGRRDVTAIVDQAKALQKKAETAQEEFEKNLQNR